MRQASGVDRGHRRLELGRPPGAGRPGVADREHTDRVAPGGVVGGGRPARVETGLEEGAEDVVHHTEHGRRDDVAARQDPDDPRVGVEAVVERAEQRAEALAWLRRERRPRHVGGEPVEQQHEQLVLVADVPVERHRRARELVRDAAHRQRLDPLPADDRLRGVDHGLPREPRRAAGAGRRGIHRPESASRLSPVPPMFRGCLGAVGIGGSGLSPRARARSRRACPGPPRSSGRRCPA